MIVFWDDEILAIIPLHSRAQGRFQYSPILRKTLMKEVLESGRLAQGHPANLNDGVEIESESSTSPLGNVMYYCIEVC